MAMQTYLGTLYLTKSQPDLSSLPAIVFDLQMSPLTQSPFFVLLLLFEINRSTYAKEKKMMCEYFPTGQKSIETQTKYGWENSLLVFKLEKG